MGDFNPHFNRIDPPTAFNETEQRFAMHLDKECAQALSLPYQPGRVAAGGMRSVRDWAYRRLVTNEIVQAVHLQALRRISMALGNPLMNAPHKTAVDLADLAVAAIAKANPSPTSAKLGSLERTFAYEQASGLISSCCVVEETDGLDQFYDLDSAEVDLSNEVAYLDSRRLLERHPEHPRWVMICDEDEPLPEAPHAA